MATRNLSNAHKALFLLGVIMLGAGVLGSPDNSEAVSIKPQAISVGGSQSSMEDHNGNSDATAASPRAGGLSPETEGDGSPAPPTTYRIRNGDTLSAIFESRGISVQELHKLLAADAEFLSLEILHPGTELTFEFDDEDVLEKLTLHLDPARKVIFARQPDGSFSYEQVEAETEWSPEIRLGAIHRNFYASGLAAGLTERQVDELRQLLKRKIDFRRQIREGDEFRVLFANEMTHGQLTGRYRIEAFSLETGGHTYNAFLFTDGNYYDASGDSVLPAFLRWPTHQRYRVSSPFSPSRIHPVTKKRRPHNGVDLATPTGTPILSTGDGVVTRIGDHPYAGKYINIRHNGSISTRYLHLSRVLVRKGERVSRGQKIALSGNTGRSTGPHLHFEFHINGRPVDPLTADIPTAAKIPSEAIASFRGLARERLALMRVPVNLNPLLAKASAAKPQGVVGDWAKQCQSPGQCRYH